MGTLPCYTTPTFFHSHSGNILLIPTLSNPEKEVTFLFLCDYAMVITDMNDEMFLQRKALFVSALELSFFTQKAEFRTVCKTDKIF
ncbi:hypothetical protein CEXT_194751 [Caerostris extrusa]|uniref:Uncharacterized protein n=1 Tax=Caerostris extrusa TaxID=172846 RepID=A0AAV4ME28_CAEEX|nr:hypothetical protein CEXT_194751 [Caerostris extrusa]